MDGPPTTASINHPVAICNTSSGYLYVIDANSNKIRKIHQTTGVASTIAGNGNSGWVDGIGSIAEFNAPAGMCYDIRGSVYIADNLNHIVRKIAVPEVFSVNEAAQRLSIELYPNPTCGELTLKAASLSSGFYLVADMLGHVVEVGRTTGEETKLDLSELQTGVYFLRLTSGVKAATQKIMIQK